VERKDSIMAFTGLFILARTDAPLTDLGWAARLGVELLGRRDDGWQLAAVSGHLDDAPGWANTLVNITAAPALIVMITHSTTALLLGASPDSPAWVCVLNAPPDSTAPAMVADAAAMSATAQEAVAWAAQAGHTVATDMVLDALSAADRASGNQATFVEVYVLRVLAVLGLAVSIPVAMSWWAQPASQVDTSSNPSPSQGS
jgi:hypothetical protein